jgi:hypothetical protein
MHRALGRHLAYDGLAHYLPPALHHGDSRAQGMIAVEIHVLIFQEVVLIWCTIISRLDEER